MVHLAADSLALLNVLIDVAKEHRAGERAELTIDASELNGKLGGNASVPYRNDAAVAQAVEWCRVQLAPTLPVLIVVDASFRKPESALLVLAFGSQPRARAMARWHEELDAIAALDVDALSSLAEKLNGEAASEAADAERAKTAAEGARRGFAAVTSASGRVAGSPSAVKRAARSKASASNAKRATGDAAKSRPKKSAVTVHVQRVDAEELASALDGLGAAGMAAAREEAARIEQAWERWQEALGVSRWKALDLGTGEILAKVQATVDDGEATWIDRTRGTIDIADKLRRKNRGGGLQDFEEMMRGFLLGDISADKFLSYAKEQFGRNYSFVSHLLFLKSRETYVPVDAAPLEAGLKRLGVTLALSSYCTWANYSRFLGHLDDIAAQLRARDMPATRLDAACVLRAIG